MPVTLLQGKEPRNERQHREKKGSTKRILTIHTGSPPRPAGLLEMMQTQEDEQQVDPE